MPQHWLLYTLLSIGQPWVEATGSTASKHCVKMLNMPVENPCGTDLSALPMPKLLNGLLANSVTLGDPVNFPF